MFGLVKDWYRGMRQRMQTNARRADLEARLYEAYSGPLLSIPRYMDQDSDGLLVGPTSVDNRAQMAKAMPREWWIECSRNLCRYDAGARSVLKVLVNFSVGRGFTLKFKTKPLQQRWDEVANSFQFVKRVKQQVRRLIRDGDVIIRRFDDGEFRFVDLMRLKTPTEHASEPNFFDGIEVNPDDVTEVLAYWIDDEPVPAEEIWHWKSPEMDDEDVRGWPMLIDAERYFKGYESWLDDRSMLNRFRASIMMFRKLKSGGLPPNVLDRLAAAVKDGTLRDSGGKDLSYSTVKPGAIISHADNIEYEFKSPNVGGQDVASDGRLMQLRVPTFFNLAEYMVTADASNANYAGLAVAESPGVQTLLCFQDDVRLALISEVAFVLQLPEDEIAGELDFTFPDPVSRRELEATRRREIRHQNGTLSRRTWMEQEGTDPEQEQPRIDEEEPPQTGQRGNPSQAANDAANGGDLDPTQVPATGSPGGRK